MDMNKIVVNEPQQNVEHLKLNGNKYGSIYKIIFPNGKHYIGLTTTSLEQRKKEHKKGARLDFSKLLYKAIRKYDMIDTIDLIEIDTADTLGELCKKEIEYIKEYNSYYLNGGNGYNMTYGGEGTNGYVHTEEERKKASERSKIQWSSQESRDEMSKIKKEYYENHPEAGNEHSVKMKEYFENHPEAGNEHSVKMKVYYENHPEARLKASERTKEQFSSQEARAQVSERSKNHHKEHPETGEKHSEFMKKFYEDPKERHANSERQKKRFEDPKERHKVSERTKEQFSSQEARERHSEAMNKRYEDQGERDKISEGLKRYYNSNPKAKEQLSERQEVYWAKPETRQQAKERATEFWSNAEAKRARADKLGQNKPFDVFKIDGTFIKTFAYQFEAKAYLHEEYGVSQVMDISSILNGKRTSSRGFTFKYK